jgi:hypothetical protein
MLEDYMLEREGALKAVRSRYFTLFLALFLSSGEVPSSAVL